MWNFEFIENNFYRRLYEYVLDEPNEVHVTPSIEQVRVTEQPIASTESLDSFDSLPQPEAAPQPEGTDFGGARPPAESEPPATNTNDDKE